MNKTSLESIFASLPRVVLMRRGKARMVAHMLALTTVVIFAVETLLMVLLEFVFALPRTVTFFLDGVLLVVLLFPLNYYFIVLPIAREIEERQRADQELSQNFEIMERFFSISDVLIAYLDSNFTFLRVNQAYADSDQHPPSYFIGKNHFDLFPNEENQAIFEEVVRTGIPYSVTDKPFEYVRNRERGITYWDWSLLPVKDQQQKVIALLMVLNNVTARKQAQAALVESERRFRAAFNQTFQLVVLLDAEGRILLANQTALDFSGVTAEAVTGKLLWEAPWNTKPIDDPLDMLEAMRRAAAGEVQHFQHALLSARGERAVLEMSLKPILDEAGRAVVLVYEARDITTYIRAEEALRHSEETSKRLYQAEMHAHQMAEIMRRAMVALSASLESGTVLETLLDHLEEIVPFTSAHINLLEDEDHLVVRLARGEEEWEGVESLLGKKYDTADLAFFQPLLRGQQVLSIPDTSLYPGIPWFPNDLFVRSWLGIPLLAGSQVIGVCILEHHCPDFFTGEMVNWASALTSQASVAIENAWLFEQVRDGREHLQALSRRLVEAQESERLHIARELHDEAGQAVASLLVGLRLMERDSADQHAVVARCAELKQIADGVLENLHRLAIDLRPASLDHLGLVAALRQHTEMVSDQHGLAIQFEAVGRIERLPNEMETAVYRIVQEAITNVVRHARASRVSILLERRGSTLLVIIEDNGVGFDPSERRQDQLGMLGMRERAIMLGGSITVESSPGQGATILLEVPCQFES